MHAASPGSGLDSAANGGMILALWLLKTEPSAFCYDDLVRLGRDRWDGVRNWAALRHMAEMRPGDLCLFYHTGEERQAVGVCRVVSESYPEPGQDDPRIRLVDVEPAYRLPRPVTLAAIKADPIFAGWDLVRQSRLSIMPVPERLWQRIHAMAGA